MQKYPVSQTSSGHSNLWQNIIDCHFDGGAWFPRPYICPVQHEFTFYNIFVKLRKNLEGRLRMEQKGQLSGRIQSVLSLPSLPLYQGHFILNLKLKDPNVRTMVRAMEHQVKHIDC